MVLLNTFKQWWQSLRFYAILDPADNSVTLSKALFQHMAKGGGNASVFVFYEPKDAAYGFMINPNIEQQTQLCTIQYNDKYKCIGFETLNPSVGRILYDYNLPHDKKVRISVLPKTILSNINYYQFCRPNEKSTRKHTNR